MGNAKITPVLMQDSSIVGNEVSAKKTRVDKRKSNYNATDINGKNQSSQKVKKGKDIDDDRSIVIGTTP